MSYFRSTKSFSVGRGRRTNVGRFKRGRYSKRRYYNSKKF